MSNKKKKKLRKETVHVMTFYAGSFPGVVQSYYRLKTNIRVYLGIDKPTKPVGVFFFAVLFNASFMSEEKAGRIRRFSRKMVTSKRI